MSVEKLEGVLWSADGWRGEGSYEEATLDDNPVESVV